MTSEEIKKQLALQQGSSNKQPAAPNLQGNVNDHSQYIDEMNRAQQEAARADLEAAYKKNVAAIDRAGVGVEKQYQGAKNQTVGTSEQEKRNFAQYATANGLNNGAGGQAELARSVALQKALGELDTKKAQTLADLELQRTSVETDYNSAIAKAKAEGDYQKANALYQEKVRVENAMSSALQQEFQNELNKYQLGYQAERDQVADDQWKQQFDFGKYQLGYQAERDQVADDQWKQQFDFGKQQYIDQLALVHGKNAGETSWGNAGASAGNTGTTGNTGAVGTGGGKSVAEVAQEVLAGKWGNGAERKAALTKAGYDYNAVQGAVDQLISDGPPNQDAGVNENFFNELVAKIKYQVDKGYENEAYSNVSRIWPELSLQQRLEVQKALAQYGLQY